MDTSALSLHAYSRISNMTPLFPSHFFFVTLYPLIIILAGKKLVQDNLGLFTILKKRSVRLEDSEREELFTIYKKNVFHFFTQSASVAPRNWCGESEERVNGTKMCFLTTWIMVDNSSKCIFVLISMLGRVKNI